MNKDRLSELDITFIYRRDHIMDAAFRFFLERLNSKGKVTEMNFRFANEEDCGLILSFIRQLAAYEKMSNQVVATENLLPEI